MPAAIYPAEPYSFKKTILLVTAGLLCLQIAFAQKRKRNNNPIQYGIASFYSDWFDGKETADGEIFDNHKLTAANNTLPLGTYVMVTNLQNKKSVIVKINDRLNYKNHRLLDLSQAAAKELGFREKGIIRVEMQVIPPELLDLFGLKRIEKRRILLYKHY
jgi:peptidoglycan lytic transglycosylase